LIQEK